MIDADISGYVDSIDQEIESSAPWVGKLFLLRKFGCQVQSVRQLCLAEGYTVDVEEKGTSDPFSIRSLAGQETLGDRFVSPTGYSGLPFACHTKNITGKPCAGNPHARFERRFWRQAVCSSTAPIIDQ